jgi:hypothetical protein
VSVSHVDVAGLGDHCHTGFVIDIDNCEGVFVVAEANFTTLIPATLSVSVLKCAKVSLFSHVPQSCYGHVTVNSFMQTVVRLDYTFKPEQTFRLYS